MTRLPLMVVFGLLLSLRVCASASASMPQFVPAFDPAFRYEGRFDRRDPAQPVYIWAGDRVAADFTGDQLALVFGTAEGQTFFDVSVDGVTKIVAGSTKRWAWPHPLEAGRHELRILKRSEADAGHVVFAGVELAAGEKLLPSAAPSYRRRIQFIGDSITVGANNEDGAADQWEDRRTHNHALSYGYLTSLALGADHRAMAVSGMGVCEGFVPMLAGETWDKVYPREPRLRANLTDWVPDLVFVNLGENDDAHSRVDGRPLPPGFTSGYVKLVRAVRTAWPQAQIVLLRGGMYGGSQSEQLRRAWEKAVGELEAADARVAHFVFAHWTETHPRVKDHRIMADELLAWLKTQKFGNL